ncbi:hypothetical protein BDW62DRAFT_17170 [Aspergillus aurantiobrunneus]
MVALYCPGCSLPTRLEPARLPPAAFPHKPALPWTQAHSALRHRVVRLSNGATEVRVRRCHQVTGRLLVTRRVNTMSAGPSFYLSFTNSTATCARFRGRTITMDRQSRASSRRPPCGYLAWSRRCCVNIIKKPFPAASPSPIVYLGVGLHFLSLPSPSHYHHPSCLAPLSSSASSSSSPKASSSIIHRHQYQSCSTTPTCETATDLSQLPRYPEHR